MKKTLVLILILLCMLLSACYTQPTNTVDSEQESKQIYTEAMTETMTETETTYQALSEVSFQEKEMLFDTQRYSDNMEDLVLNDKKIVKLYSLNNFGSEYQSLDARLEQCEDKRDFHYLAIGEDAYKVSLLENGTVYFQRKYDGAKSFWNEFDMVNTDVVIFDTTCHVNEVICFDDMYDGTVNYIITDQGIYVKYYLGGLLDEGRLFTDTDFQLYHTAYTIYVDETREDRYETGGLCVFASFLKDEVLVEKYIQKVISE